MARDALGALIPAETRTGATTGTTGATYDLQKGTPRRGIAIAWNTKLYGPTAGAAATLTLQQSDSANSGFTTLQTFDTQTTTAASTASVFAVADEQTVTVSTTKRYIRTSLTTTGTTASSVLEHNAYINTGQPA